MYLDTVTIKNFRALEEFEITFQPGMNLIIGDNGTGKTSIMESLATSLAGIVYHLDGPNAHNIHERDIRMDYIPLSDTSYAKKYYTPTTINTVANIEGETFTWLRSRNSELPKAGTGMKSVAIKQWSREKKENPESLWPLIVYRKANRMYVPEDEKNITIPLAPIERSQGYKGSLKGEIIGAYQWILKMEMAGMSGKKPREYLLFKETMAQAIQSMMGSDREAEIKFDIQTMKLLYKEGTKMIPIEQVSAGYYWALWMLMDLIIRALILNPNIYSISAIEGIVLIDEIDLHLHPRWQWNILNTLQGIFPKVQFIASTHAPIVISSGKNANLIRLDKEQQIDYLDSVYAFSIRDVVELTQGSHGVLPELKELYYSFEEAVNSEDYATAVNLNTRLQKCYPNSTEARKADVMVQFFDLGEMQNALH